VRGPDSLGRGWWRRNAWGLVAVIPAFAAMVYASVYSNLEFWQRSRPEPVPAAADGTAAFAGVKLRLLALEPATDLQRFNGSPFTPPAGMTAWRALLEIDAAGAAEVPYCTIAMEDSAGNLYGDRPEELSRAKLPIGNCRPDNSLTAPVSGRHQTVAYFVTAAGADAAAVRVSFGSVDLIRYVRLSRGG
jgi:hypothetical protein